jgi:uncharacterized protein YbjT (DUF2867 family)
MIRTFSIIVLVFVYFSFCAAMTIDNKKLVAVTGATGRLGRRVVVNLSKQGVPTRCLVRREVPEDTKPDESKLIGGSSVEVAAYLRSLPNVELVVGDVTNNNSIDKLMTGCTSVLSLHGPVPGPVWKSLIPLIGTKEDDAAHSKMINYVSLQYMIEAAKAGTCNRIVRITGKGEDPYGFFSILINMLGTMAKAWNYEGEELLRQSGLNYTIIRPGIMGTEPCPGKVKALKDDGQDLPVSRVCYDQIADLAVECLDYENAAKSTLTAMNVEEGKGEETYAPLLKQVQPDRRNFPPSLLAEHKNAARLGAAFLVGFAAVSAKLVLTVSGKVLRLMVGK